MGSNIWIGANDFESILDKSSKASPGGAESMYLSSGVRLDTWISRGASDRADEGAEISIDARGNMHADTGLTND